MKKKQFTVGITGLALIFLLALGGCPDGGGNETQREKAGGDEVKGKTFYMGSSYKTIFSANETFETFDWRTVSLDPYKEDWLASAKGSYSYNSENKTFTLFITQVIREDDAAFSPRTFMYEITSEGSLLAQEVYENKGIDQLKGGTYTLPSPFGWGGPGSTEYGFAATGNTYSCTEWRGKNTGTYYYDADLKTVWLRPASIGGVTITGYYDAYNLNGYLGPLTAAADKKASATNEAFVSEKFTYDPAAKTLERGGFSANIF
jgi:hypothetical protein